MKKNWIASTLGEFCQIKPPKGQVKELLEKSDLVSFVPMSNLGIRERRLQAKENRALASVYKGYTYFSDGDVLLAKITPCFENGKLTIASNLTNGTGFGSSEFIVFRPNEYLNSDFLFYFLSQDAFRDAGKKAMSGAVGHKRITKDFIKSFPIQVPPLAEQKRIVAILDDAFAGIDTAIANTEKNLANAQELFESHFDEIFSYSESAWSEYKLKDVTDDNCSLSYGIVQPGENYDKGLPVVRPTDLSRKLITEPGLKK